MKRHAVALVVALSSLHAQDRYFERLDPIGHSRI
jgi:hypothetical protein